MTINHIKKELESLGDPDMASHSQSFFKTGPGEYGEGDLFRGIRVPRIRAIAKKFNYISITQATELLSSEYHEDRFAALCILIDIYTKSDIKIKKLVYQTYMQNMKHINNWDLVDVSAPNIVGNFLIDKDRKPLFKLAKSKDLWERRVSIVSTFAFIRRSDLSDTYAIAEILLHDSEDLIHKATGWMLREAGKRDIESEELFLKKHCATMPRTMMRYAIEKFSQSKREMILAGKF
ncbi:MAG TPA: DNA alkylation repair protein [bacterium]|nr:DNA alkylation repair protein [bacterium]